MRRRASITTTLPAPARILGTEFVEFAVDDEGGRELETVLGGLGFTKTAQHRSKAVELWSQADIKLVLNRENEGFAHSHQITHGASVCALAFNVDDATSAANRAASLRDQPFRQPVTPGELDIPAVRGVGGSLLYLVDGRSELGRWWDVDFEPLSLNASSQSAGLTRIDHISQTMRYEEMLTWLLFYTSLFDLAKSPTQAVVDPGGVVQSQVVETADGAMRLVLNTSQSGQTLSSRFLSDVFGAGVQHIAFATDDILSTVDMLRVNGVDLLPIPANYYDDLETRADLGPEMIDRLRAGNILYDGDGHSEFFQVYTKAVLETGFFFEIVQRRNNRGFGAVNAPIRLAAQARLAPPRGMPRVKRAVAGT